jgi:hypothetical protein
MTLKRDGVCSTKPHEDLPSGLPAGLGFSYGALLYYFPYSSFVSSTCLDS